VRIKLKETIELEAASLDDFLNVVESNRARIRALASMILSVCGMVLSSSLVVLFFVLKEKSIRIRVFCSAYALRDGCRVVARCRTECVAALPLSPVAIYTKLEMVDSLSALYRREYHRAVASVVFLVVGLLSFFLALGVFGWSSLFP
jgi:hypothetical protein